MPENKDLKRRVRERMAATGERYTDALAHLLNQVPLEPLPPGWVRTGDRSVDYEVGLLPAAVAYERTRVVRLRLRDTVPRPSGFGALAQSIAATRYRGQKVRFSAAVRTEKVTGWAGLWLRVDGANGVLVLDNMQDRSLRGSTEWTPAEIVLGVAQEAVRLNFGVLLSGAGAVDVARLHFEQVDESVPVTIGPLPDEPQNLDFGAAT